MFKRVENVEDGKVKKKKNRNEAEAATAARVWRPFMSHGLLIVLFTVS